MGRQLASKDGHDADYLEFFKPSLNTGFFFVCTSADIYWKTSIRFLYRGSNTTR